MMTPTIATALDLRAAQQPDAPAILDVSGDVLSFAELTCARDALEHNLRSLAVEPGDRIGVIMASSPDLAMAMLAIVSFGTCLPVDPSLTAAEVSDLLRRCGVVAVLHDTEHAPLAIEACRLALVPAMHAQYGWQSRSWTVAGEGREPRVTRTSVPGPDDIAALIATSGTTGRPKIIPLRHRNVLAAVSALTSALDLGPRDRALAAVPFWFGQGFVSTLVASLVSGGSIVCVRHMVPAHFGEWLTRLEPTWYTAPPSLQSHILAATRDLVPAHGLRFVRVAGASLPPDVRHALHARFGVPVIDVYGLTEALGVAVSPMTSAQLPDGAIGRPTSTANVTIVRSSGALADRGELGEIIIRGPMVVDGYFDDPVETAAKFRHGALHTGDLGTLDEAGNLFVFGRVSEIINRGGSKISPAEVEAVFRRHPGILDVAVFPIAHGVNGEEVGAAIVARRGYRLNGRQLRRFASGLLPNWKVPSAIVLVPELPHTPSGKVPRSQLAKQLGVTMRGAAEDAPDRESPKSVTEQTVAALFVRYLNLPDVGRHVDFFSVGGDSFKAFQVVEALRDSQGVNLPVSAVYRWPTVAELAGRVDALRGEGTQSPGGDEDQPRITLVNVLYDGSLDSVSEFLDPAFDLIDIVFPRKVILESEQSVEALADRCMADLAAVCPRGPYVLAGHSFAALVAFEMALRLRASGVEVPVVMVIDRAAPNATVVGTRLLMGRLKSQTELARALRVRDYLRRASVGLSRMVKRRTAAAAFRVSRLLGRPVPGALLRHVPYKPSLARRYQAGTFDGDILLFRTGENEPNRDNARSELGWSAYTSAQVHVAEIDGDHLTILRGSGARAMAARINEFLLHRATHRPGTPGSQSTIVRS